MAPRPLFRLLLVLLGSFYLGNLCEFDAAECRQNYANECHEYVAAPLGAEVPAAPAAQPDDVPALLPSCWTERGTAPARRPAFGGRGASAVPWPWVANPPPLHQLYLRYAVLQV